MLWKIIFSNFEIIIHNASVIKDIPKHILQCRFTVFIFSLLYIYECIWSIINDYATVFNLVSLWKMTVKDECMLCIFCDNKGIDLTNAYINTIINYQENSHSTHCFYSTFNIGVLVITDYTHSNFSNSVMCVSFTLLGGHCLYNSNLSIYPLLSGQN